MWISGVYNNYGSNKKAPRLYGQQCGAISFMDQSLQCETKVSSGSLSERYLVKRRKVTAISSGVVAELSLTKFWKVLRKSY